ncbi:hypothetical protein SAMN05444167_2241 [Terriglobus roseus]|uniref:Uncharacterized protein n=1 Tax=Terriglobus roseus TaxID=392734 RepID=A0A1G7KM83_9BACT|nr:hypothetical protein SAMN05444167_2241 [Terriglobus roseus]
MTFVMLGGQLMRGPVIGNDRTSMSAFGNALIEVRFSYWCGSGWPNV